MKQIVNKQYRPMFQPPKGVRYIILMGGRGAGRSTVVSQYLKSKLVAPEYLRAAMMRFVLSDIRNSCFKEIKDRIDEQETNDAIDVNESNMSVRYGSNEINAHGFRKSSGEQSAKLKSLANYNVVWIEEADEVLEADFMQLDDSLRTVKGDIYIVLSLNPPPKNHWIIKRWFTLMPSEENGFYIPECHHDDVLYIRTDYHDNAKNLDEHTRKRYEGYRITNPEYYWNMIKGYVPEVLIGKIYANWREIDAVPHEARLLGYGVDFGFKNDPDAIVGVYYHNGGYILDEKHYSSGNDHDALVRVCKMLTPAPMVVDYAEARMVGTLRQASLNVIECDKGAGSIEFGIRHVQGLPISYTKNSVNLKAEYEQYSWMRNKDGGEKNVPDSKCADHLLDASRYFLTKMVQSNADPEAKEREKVNVLIKRESRVSTRRSKYVV